MRQLFCITYITAIGATCTAGAVYFDREPTSLPTVFMGVAAFVCFLVIIGCVVQYGCFYNAPTPDDTEE